MADTKKTHGASFRLTDEAWRLLTKLADQLGVSRTAVVEMAVREKAKKDGVK